MHLTHRTHPLLTFLIICSLISTSALNSMDDEPPTKRVRFAPSGQTDASSSSSSAPHDSTDSTDRIDSTDESEEITLEIPHKAFSFNLREHERLTNRSYRDILKNPHGAFLAVVCSRVQNENSYALYDATSPIYLRARDANHTMPYTHRFKTYYFITPSPAEPLTFFTEEGTAAILKDETLLATACSAVHGDRDAQTKLGRIYLDEFRGGDRHRTAYAWFSKAAEQGDTDALCELGNLYRLGLGVQQDRKKMLEKYHEAAAKNSSLAQQLLGELYCCGESVQKDYAIAFAWFQKAAALEELAAQNNLGYLYEKGLGIKQDYTMAFHWYEKASHTLLEARCNLALLFAHGRGVKHDRQEARKIYQDLCNKEYSPSSAELVDRFAELAAMIAEEKP